MRYLPMFIAVMCVAPLFVWVGVEMMLSGSSTVFSDENMFSILAGGALTIAALFAGAWWFGKKIADGK